MGGDPRALWHRRVAAVLLASVCVTGVGCRSRGIPLPPITATATGVQLVGKFVWMDLVTGDLAASKAFYGKLFDWEFAEHGGYVTVLRGGTPIAGMVERQAGYGEPASLWIASLSVVDVDRAVDAVQSRGGVLERGPFDRQRGRIALVRDPGGALFAVMRSKTGDPPDHPAQVGGWLWRELWTRDARKAVGFYGAVAGYESERVDFRDTKYDVLTVAGVPRAGIVEHPLENANPTWVPYVRVDDDEEAVRRARALGGQVVWRGDDSAILLDPQGAPIGLQRWSGPGPEAEGRR